MNELSLYILDIVQNSIRAQAKNIAITIEENVDDDALKIRIEDDGIGMENARILQVSDPFYTTRSSRKVGMGIPLFKEQVEFANGTFKIESQINRGTTIEGLFQYSHVDRLPLGDMEETLYALVFTIENCSITYKHKVNDNIFEFDTNKIEEILDGVSIRDYAVLCWMKTTIQEGFYGLYKEVL